MITQFEAVIEEGARGGALVEVPEGALEALGGGGRIKKVKATFDGEPYRGSVVRMGGRAVIGVVREVRATIGKQVGDPVHVVLTRDTEKRVVKAPVELAEALRERPAAKSQFDGLSYTHRKEYAEWVGEAKKAETRQRRAAKAVEMLEKGRTL